MYANHFQNLEKSTIVAQIKKTTGFEQVYTRDISPKQRNEIFLAIKPKLLDMIKSLDDFLAVINFFPIEHCAELCTELKQKIPTLFHSVPRIGEAFEGVLSDEKFEVICKVLQSELIHLIKNPGKDDIYKKPAERLCVWLLFCARGRGVKKSIALCCALESELPNIMVTTDSFINLLYYLDGLNEEQWTVLFDIMGPYLSAMIKTPEDLHTVFSHKTHCNKSLDIQTIMTVAVILFRQSRKDNLLILEDLVEEFKNNYKAASKQFLTFFESSPVLNSLKNKQDYEAMPMIIQMSLNESGKGAITKILFELLIKPSKNFSHEITGP